MGNEEDRGTAPQTDEGRESEPVEEEVVPPTEELGEGSDQDGTLRQPGAEPGPDGDDNEEVEIEVDGVKIKSTKGFQKRINSLTKKVRDAERRESYWRGVAEGGGRPADREEGSGGDRTVVVPAGPPTMPDPSDYEHGIYDPTYIKDNNEFLIAAAEYRFEQRRKESTEGERTKEIHKSFIKRMKEAEKEDPLILEMMEDPEFFPANRPEIAPVVAIIKESEMAPQILTHLYTHRDELESILRLAPVSAAREIGKLEAKITGAPKTQTRKVSQAPKPVKPVGDGGSGPPLVDAEDDKLSTEEFMKRRNQKQFNRGRG